MPQPERKPRKIVTVANVLTVAVVCLIGLNIWHFVVNRPSEHALVDMVAPELSLYTVSEGHVARQKISTSDLRGRVVLLDFWALHCPPCLDQMPHVQDLVDELSPDDFALMSVNLDEGTFPERASRIGAFMKEEKFHFTVTLGDGRTLETYQVERLPTMMILDRDGHIRRVYIGRTPPEIIRDDLNDLLEAKSS